MIIDDVMLCLKLCDGVEIARLSNNALVRRSLRLLRIERVKVSPLTSLSLEIKAHVAVLMLQSLSIQEAQTYTLAAGDSLMEIEGFTSVYTNAFTKSVLLNQREFY
ncbi:hypothetical protein Bca101_018911 [Brassica carinata]